MLLADVSGHGASVAPVAVALRDLMRQNINFIKQTHLVSALNSKFEGISADGCFATTLVSTFFSPTRTLSVCNAGHPVPLFRDASTGRWTPY
jgi:serine phosphatase RsbU (regulator of sigma subunit)